MSSHHNPRIVTDGLVLSLDAANPKSYPGSGTTWSDLTKNNNDITSSAVSYVSAENSMVYITYNSLIHGTSHVNIIDLNGRSVYSAELDGSHIGENKEMIRIPSSVKNGMYVVHFFVDNVGSSKSVSIQR